MNKRTSMAIAWRLLAAVGLIVFPLADAGRAQPAQAEVALDMVRYAAPCGLTYDPQRWGISVEKIKALGPKLREHWQRFRLRFKNKTRNTSEHALAYMQGQMTMESERNFAGILKAC